MVPDRQNSGWESMRCGTSQAGICILALLHPSGGVLVKLSKSFKHQFLH